MIGRQGPSSSPFVKKEEVDNTSRVCSSCFTWQLLNSCSLLVLVGHLITHLVTLLFAHLLARSPLQVRPVGSKGVVAVESMGLHFMNETSAKSFSGYHHKQRQSTPQVRIHLSSSSAHHEGEGTEITSPKLARQMSASFSGAVASGAGPSASKSHQGNGMEVGQQSSMRRGENEGSSIEVVAVGDPQRTGSRPSMSGTDTTASIEPTEHGMQKHPSCDSSGRIEVVTHGPSNTDKQPTAI